MTKHALATVLVILGTAVPAAAECVARFKPSETSGAMAGMVLYRFDSHWELQVDTPAQGSLNEMALAIDGVRQPVTFSGGLDDLLFVVSSEESALQLSDEFLAAFARGKTITFTARTETTVERAVYVLNGSGAAVKRLARGCK